MKGLQVNETVGNDVYALHEEIEHLVGHLVRNDVNTLHEEITHLVGFSLIRVLEAYPVVAGFSEVDLSTNDKSKTAKIGANLDPK
jgi:hypothetical protein